ncbi:hypothetical protein M3Y97_01015800 [Aphelenchoides bicaudatus]|nr:hypothetical protein M3Y97_01015800 [Aphelenchoides bicaudatus]
MPSTRRSTRYSIPRAITPIPKSKKAQVAKAPPTSKKKSQPTPSQNKTTRRSTSSKSDIPVESSPETSSSPPSPVVNQLKRAYIIDSDEDSDIQVIATVSKQKKIQESDEENEGDAPKADQPSSTNLTSRTPSRISIQSLKRNKPLVESDDEVPARKLSTRIRRPSTRALATKARKENLKPVKKEEKKFSGRLIDSQRIKDLEKTVESKLRRPARQDTKRERFETTRRVTTIAKGAEDDEVEAEFNVVILRPQSNTCLSRIQFQQQPLQSMDSCHGRLKKQVKHLELAYRTRKNGEIMYDKIKALYDAIGFFKAGGFYILPVHESFEMMRQVVRPADINVIEQNRTEDSNLAHVNAPPVLNPVRVRFARTETEWQRRKREQSFQYRQMLYDQDQWIDTKVNKEKVQTVYKKEISRSKGPSAARRTNSTH